MKPYKSILREMSYHRNDILHAVQSRIYTTTEHILKLLLFPKFTQSHGAWIGTIITNILKISAMKWKSNKKYLPKEDYFAEFYTKFFENDDNYEILDKLSLNILDENEDIYSDFRVKNIPKEKWIEKLKLFFNDISSSIVNNTIDKKSCVEFIKKYFK
jgi:uncharacterized protein (UPF0332 family)